MMIINVLCGLVVIGACFWVFYRTYGIWQLNQARRKGLYPSQRTPTMFDVRKLLLAGEKDLAVRLYRQIFPVDEGQARREVEDLVRGMREQGATGD